MLQQLSHKELRQSFKKLNDHYGMGYRLTICKKSLGAKFRRRSIFYTASCCPAEKLIGLPSQTKPLLNNHTLCHEYAHARDGRLLNLLSTLYSFGGHDEVFEKLYKQNCKTLGIVYIRSNVCLGMLDEVIG